MTQSANDPKPAAGHPPALYLLFFSEMWERFCFYGMRALLKLYMIETLILESLGDADKKTREGAASLVYGSYLALVYGAAIVGGIVADRLLGYRRSILVGGSIMALGLFLMLVEKESFFFAGLATVVVGNGLFKPNISTMVGKLYEPGDPRRDGGFSIFYMGINIGACIAPLICGFVGERYGHRWGFLLAGIGMVLGVLTFYARQRILGDIGGVPAERKNPKKDLVSVLVGAALCVPAAVLLLKQEAVLSYVLLGALLAIFVYLLRIGMQGDRVQRHRMWALVILLTMNVGFWALFEQAGNSLTTYTKDNVDRVVFGVTVPTSWFQTLNALFIVAFAPLFTMVWNRLRTVNANPPAPSKFALGLIGVGLGYGVLVFGNKMQAVDGVVPITWITLLYLVHTFAELCISPVGLSWMSKLAPDRCGGMVLGAWFLSTAVGNNVAGWISEATSKAQVGVGRVAQLGGYNEVFQSIFVYFSLGGLVLLILTPLVNRLLHGLR